jgi:hypothetical protein
MFRKFAGHVWTLKFLVEDGNGTGGTVRDQFNSLTAAGFGFKQQ